MLQLLSGPAAELGTRLQAGMSPVPIAWSDGGGSSRGIQAVLAEAGRWWAPTPTGEVTMAVLDSIATGGAALAETRYLTQHGTALGLGHAVIDLTEGTEPARHHGDPGAAARGIEVPDFPRPAARTAAPGSAARQQAAVRDFFGMHDEIGGVLAAWEKYADPDVLLWHSAEGVRARGREALLDFYARQHGRYAYSSVRWELHVIASRPGYTTRSPTR
ncbi:hypothetical protein [Streptomyces brasiliensis]|uniref:Uncharacterized protein n=1 Tax=Streptomyces brasiliensis TaxID=1954 RepID=A0A917L438_9ACTN|nr:hypothetical protein [Streptomyces brasiliensis]GGJ41132.1 hypothetical protein GCM10010121_060210 [Streptomyces brasiliensis]